MAEASSKDKTDYKLYLQTNLNAIENTHWVK